MCIRDRVHVDGVEVVYLLVPTDGVHIGVESLARVEAVALQGQTLPLGQGMDHFGVEPYVGNIEADGTLHTCLLYTSPVSREELLEEFLRLSREEGVTILFSTHITSDLDRCADEILYLLSLIHIWRRSRRPAAASTPWSMW